MDLILFDEEADLLFAYDLVSLVVFVLSRVDFFVMLEVLDPLVVDDVDRGHALTACNIERKCAWRTSIPCPMLWCARRTAHRW